MFQCRLIQYNKATIPTPRFGKPLQVVVSKKQDIRGRKWAVMRQTLSVALPDEEEKIGLHLHINIYINES